MMILCLKGRVWLGRLLLKLVVPMSVAIALGVEQALVSLKFQQETKEKLPLTPPVPNHLEPVLNWLMYEEEEYEEEEEEEEEDDTRDDVELLDGEDDDA